MAKKMTKRSMWKLVLKWSILTSFLMFIGWFFYYLKHGSVPVESTTILFPGWNVEVSRWADLLIGPIWSTLGIWVGWKVGGFDKPSSLWRDTKNTKEEWYVWILLIILLFTFFVALNSGIIGGLVVAAVCILLLTVACFASPLIKFIKDTFFTGEYEEM